MNKLYRIQTEAVNVATVRSIVADAFEAFTIVSTQGVWKGSREASLTIEIVGALEDRAEVFAIARQIKLANAQEAVLVTTQDIQGELI
jgi:hypothetical protein